MGLVHGAQRGEQGQGPAAGMGNECFHALVLSLRIVWRCGLGKSGAGDVEECPSGVVKGRGQRQGRRLRRQAETFKKIVEVAAGCQGRRGENAVPDQGKERCLQLCRYIDRCSVQSQVTVAPFVPVGVVDFLRRQVVKLLGCDQLQASRQFSSAVGVLLPGAFRGRDFLEADGPSVPALPRDPHVSS